MAEAVPRLPRRLGRRRTNHFLLVSGRVRPSLIRVFAVKSVPQAAKTQVEEVRAAPGRASTSISENQLAVLDHGLSVDLDGGVGHRKCKTSWLSIFAS